MKFLHNGLGLEQISNLERGIMSYKYSTSLLDYRDYSSMSLNHDGLEKLHQVAFFFSPPL